MTKYIIHENDVYTPEEQAANRKVWSDALRSGKYAQAKGTLREKNSYCCLGVACDVYDPNGWKSTSEHRMVGESIDHTFLKEWSATLPLKLQHALGLTDSGEFKTEGKEEITDNLIHYNDTEKYTFEQIADLIDDPKNKWMSPYGHVTFSEEYK